MSGKRKTPRTSTETTTENTDRIKERRWMRDAFIDVQAELDIKIKRASGSIKHGGQQGAVNEDNWLEILRAYLPDRYEVDSGTIIDSRGSRSDQIDIVIHDRHFTPTLLNQQRHRYIPAEAVYAVFECKPHIDKAYLDYAGNKAASVRRLHRTSIPIPHAGGVYPAKPHNEILAGILAERCDWQDGMGESFQKHLPRTGLERLDCGCALNHGAFELHPETGLSVVPAGGALMYFLFRLLSRLQSLGSVPAIDWLAYAEILRD